MTVDPGKLDKMIEIIERNVTVNENGYEAGHEDRVVRRCPAMFSRQSGTEITKAQADFQRIKVRFLVRWTPAEINRRMIVRYAGRKYGIEYVNDYGDGHRYIELWCGLLSLEG